MKKVNNTYFMGDKHIEVTKGKNGGNIATLHSADSFGVLEIENVNGVARIKDLQFGSAFVEVEHLAILIKEAGLSDALIKELNKIG